MRLDWVIQAFYIASASGILVANAIPELGDRFIHYGPRSAEKASPHVVAAAKVSADDHAGVLNQMLNLLAHVQVPHGWFLHFYLVAISSLLFWLLQYITRGTILQTIAVYNTPGESPAMTLCQVQLLWLMMMGQGVRRLYESIVFAKPSSSTMWIAHYLIGVAFYLVTSVAVWIEGVHTLQVEPFSFKSLTFPAPSVSSFIAIPLFLMASGVQHDCHGYLASLKKYSLPAHPAFSIVLCPHYLMECVIYLSMAIAGAPAGRIANTTMLTAFVFVTINLGVTAGSTHRWYAHKFGEDKTKDRWCMIPWVY